MPSALTLLAKKWVTTFLPTRLYHSHTIALLLDQQKEGSVFSASCTLLRRVKGLTFSIRFLSASKAFKHISTDEIRKEQNALEKNASSEKKSRDLHPAAIVKRLNALKKSDKNPAEIEFLCSIALEKFKDFKPRDIFITLNALTKLEHHDEKIVKALCGVIPEKAKYFTSQDVSICLNALSKLRHVDLILVEKLCQFALVKVKQFCSKDIALTLNALAKFEHFDESLVRALCSAALGTVKDLGCDL